jgi:hypothetical protein
MVQHGGGGDTGGLRDLGELQLQRAAFTQDLLGGGQDVVARRRGRAPAACR